jgi:hypothetical protein
LAVWRGGYGRGLMAQGTIPWAGSVTSVTSNLTFSCYICYKCDMAACNIRNIESSQLAAWKQAALASGMNLREWVVAKLSEAANGLGQTYGVIKPPHLQRVRSGVRNDPDIEGRAGDTGPSAIQRSPDHSPTNTGTVDRGVPEVQATRWLGPKHSAKCKCKRCTE